MRRLLAPLAVVAALLAGLVPLLLLEGGRRAWGFRLYTIVLGVLAVRAVLHLVEATPAPPATSPFRRRSRLAAAVVTRVRRRRRTLHHYRGSAQLVRSATGSAGTLHHRLRPVLQSIAGERLHVRHGLAVDDARVAALVSPSTWELLRPDRPAPAERRAPGAPLAVIRAALDDLEKL
ncbi:MAG TPA: hypothetical protein VHN98_08125 [Acidimicrobiales bacterium]|nr:hypothetical protein [Acidimicrobiales bacterium]